MLTSELIKFHLDNRTLVIEPFDSKQLNPNSYNLTLGDSVMVYNNTPSRMLDPRRENTTTVIPIPEEGLVLQPYRLYLATSREYTESLRHVPMINGRSSLARLGLSVHQTGGFGDIGFCGRWTLEISVIQPVIVYCGLEIAQICWFEPAGLITKRYSGRYQGQRDITPCLLHKDTP